MARRHGIPTTADSVVLAACYAGIEGREGLLQRVVGGEKRHRWKS